MQPLRIGLLGAGRIVRLVHAAALARLTDARVTVLAEADDARRAEAARDLPGATPCADWREALDQADLDAVIICLPNPLHAPAAEAAFARKLHVYLEKPIATTLEEGERVRAAWHAAGRVGMTGFNYRFHPLHRAARARLEAGALGPLVAIRTAFTTPARALPSWQRARESGGGVLLNLGVHHIDLVTWLTGARVAAVGATLRSHASEQDGAVFEAVLENGVPVQSLFSMSAAPADRVVLIGERGTLAVDRLGGGARFTEVGAPRVTGALRGLREGIAAAVRGARRTWRGAAEPSFDAAFRTFHAAARGDAAPHPDIDAGLTALRVVCVAERSAAHTGRLTPVEPQA